MLCRIAVLMMFAAAPSVQAQAIVPDLPTAPLQSVVADAAAVAQVLQIDQVIGIMRDEGLAYGAQLAEELFPEAGSARWVASVELIYDAATMERRFADTFARELGDDPALLAPVIGFFAAPLGQRIIDLELTARRALLDETVEAAAAATFADMAADGGPRVGMLRRFAEANDLIEQNVAGALNANLAFYRGMAQGGAFGSEMDEAGMLADVWAQEPEVRTEAETWLFPFLALSYEPLADADLEAYIAFSETAAGQKLNLAMFAAFDVVFSAISRDLGRAAAEMLAGQDI